MKLEQQVTSLEISKKLEELGVKQESLHYWMYVEAHDDYELDNGNFEMQYSAFTVAELGEIINEKLKPEETHRWYTYKGVKWFGYWFSHGTVIDADIEADARGKILIYLLENKLILK